MSQREKETAHLGLVSRDAGCWFSCPVMLPSFFLFVCPFCTLKSLSRSWIPYLARASSWVRLSPVELLDPVLRSASDLIYTFILFLF